jgi:hypothetical protein
VARFNNAIWREEMTEIKPLSVRIHGKAVEYNDVELHECALIINEAGKIAYEQARELAQYKFWNIINVICILLLVAKQWGWL